MGYLGFLFSLTHNDHLLQNTQKPYHAVFVSTANVQGVCLIGLKDFFNQEETITSRLDKDLLVSNFHHEVSSIKYGRLSVHETTIFDFKNLTIWAKPVTYKYVRSLLEVKEGNPDLAQELLIRVDQLVEFLRISIV